MSTSFVKNSGIILCRVVAKQIRKEARNFSVSTCRKMRLVQYKLKQGGCQQLGAQLSIGGDIIDISAVDSTIPNSMVQFLEGGTSTYDKAKR